jgi:hypothetical protein
MSVLEVCFAFLLSVIVFHFCYQLGRRSQNNKTPKCGISNTDHIAIAQDFDESLCPYECSDLKYETRIHEISINFHEARNGGSVVERAFSDIHHPAASSNTELIVSNGKPIKSLDDCHSYYLTRTGSRTSMAAKCVAVVSVPEGPYQYNSPWLHSHRVGTSANLTDQVDSTIFDATSIF